MSCNHCSTKFNFFHKEVGCSSCGFSFCSKCLKQKCRIPDKGSGEYAVCKTCFLELSSGNGTTRSTPPPDAYFKRLEALENASHSPVATKKSDMTQPSKCGLSPFDQNLSKRLENLKDKGTGPPPTEAELRKRLNILKDENNYVEGPSKPILSVHCDKTDQQKADDLLEEFKKTKYIELLHRPTEEMEARLANLRKQGVRPNENDYVSNLRDSPPGSDEEAAIDALTMKIMDEVALENKSSLGQFNVSKLAEENMVAARLPPPEYVDDHQDELPWCVLCNKDAKYRCMDCGGDLYCANCNKEVHVNWGDGHHSVVPFQTNK